MISRQGNLAEKKELAKVIAGIPSAPKAAEKKPEKAKEPAPAK